MAYENLRAAITQNIKTNNQEEITGAVMQQILLQMVNELGAWDSALSSFATTQWVQEQLNGYVSQSALSNYLPLTGGTMTGPIVAGDLTGGMYTLNHERISFSYSYNGNYRYSQDLLIGKLSDEMVISFTGRNGASQGTLIKGSSVTSNSFIKNNGTSAQFLKADGSVDENTYATTSALSRYLPLTGGTMTGRLNVGGTPENEYGIYTPWDIYAGYGITSAGRIYLTGENADLLAIRVETDGIRNLFGISTDDNTLNNNYWETSRMKIASKFKVGDAFYADEGTGKVGIGTASPSYKLHVTGQVGATGFIKSGGTSDQVLCADGSVKTLAQLKAALNAL